MVWRSRFKYLHLAFKRFKYQFHALSTQYGRLPIQVVLRLGHIGHRSRSVQVYRGQSILDTYSLCKDKVRLQYLHRCFHTRRLTST